MNHSLKLFAVYLGGYAPRCQVELHDMVFVTGTTVKKTYPLLVKKWFLKTFNKFHLDGYLELSVVDGHKIKLSRRKPRSTLKLFYVHLGAYDPTQLNELHRNCFIVARTKQAAKARAKKSWVGWQVHKDFIADVECCIAVDQVDGHYLHLKPTSQKSSEKLYLGYDLIPKSIIQSFRI